MTRRRRRATIRFRTTAVASVVVLVALTTGGAVLVWIVRDHLVGSDRSAAELRARDVLALARSASLPSSLSFPGEEDSATQVVTRSGKVITSTDNIEDEPPMSELRPSHGESESEITKIDELDDEQRYVVVAVTSRDGRMTVLAAVSLGSTEETVSTLTRALLVGLPILVLVVAVTTRVLVGRALRPVADITAEVSDITDRELERRVPEPGTADEIDELAVTMNRMLERLEAASKRQRRFVADASHELRSPLASARAVLEVAALHPGSREALVKAIEEALVDHDRLDRLTMDLLELAKLDDHRLAMRTTSVDVDALIGSLIDRRTEDTIDTDVHAGVRQVNEQVLTRVLTNLLDNASRHRTNRTKVTVVGDRDGFVLRVDDDGPGVAPEDRSRIFEAFTRLDEARVADRGTGLGLAIVHELLTAVGGTISVETSALGGASFVVRFPDPTNLGGPTP